MRRRYWVAYALGIGLSGAPLVASAASQADQVAQQKSQAFAQASGTQAGTIDNRDGGTLNITPYNTSSDVKAFELPAGTPVFQGNGKITDAGLLKGVPVRIHYKNAAAAGQKPQVAAVEVLGTQEANAAKQQAQSAPPLMMAQVGPTPSSPTGNIWAPTKKMDQSGQQQKADILASASGSQPGKITKVDSGKLYLDPYQKAAGEAELQFDPNAPVFQGNGRVASNALMPGSDVRVYYRNEPNNQRPKVIAVEILDKDQAKQLEKSERDVPRGK
jgi:hypothetical protein